MNTGTDSESQETDIEEDNTEENNQPDVDEDSIEESGVQENSSDVEPSEILTADDIDTESSDTLTEEDEEQVLEEIQDVVDSTVADEIAVEQSSSIRVCLLLQLEGLLQIRLKLLILDQHLLFTLIPILLQQIFLKHTR